MGVLNKQVLDVFSEIWRGYRINPNIDFMSDVSFMDVATERYNTDVKINIILNKKRKVESWTFSIYKKYDDNENNVTVSVDHLSYPNIDNFSNPSNQHYEFKVDDDFNIYFKGNPANTKISILNLINFIIEKQNEIESYFMAE